MPASPNVRLPGFGPGRGDHVADRLERRIRLHQQDVRRRTQQRDRGEILERVVGQLRVQERIGRMAAGDHQQGVAVRWRNRQRLRGDHAAGAGPVFDHDRLAPFLRHRFTERARQNIDGATGGVSKHVNMHLFGRKRRLGRRAAAGQHRQRRPPTSRTASPSQHSLNFIVSLIAYRLSKEPPRRRPSKTSPIRTRPIRTRPKGSRRAGHRIQRPHVDNPEDRVQVSAPRQARARPCRDHYRSVRHRGQGEFNGGCRSTNSVPGPRQKWDR